MYLKGLEGFLEAAQLLVGACQQLLLLPHPQPDRLQVLHTLHPLLLPQQSPHQKQVNERLCRQA